MSTTTSTFTDILPKTNCCFNWEKTPLTNAKWESSKSYDLSSDLGFEKALSVLSEDLSFCEKLKIAKEASHLHNFDDKVFFTEAGYTRIDLIKQIRLLVEKLPKDFTNWCSQKKLNLKDFRAFLKDYNSEKDQSFFSKLASLDPTKNTGLQIIELYFDLCAQEKLETAELLKFKNAETLLKSLHKKRFSVTLSKDQAISDELSKIKISTGIKLSLKRNGDKRQIRLELDADSPADLKDKLERSITKTESFHQAWNTGVSS